jgi:hypothetical protein
MYEDFNPLNWFRNKKDNSPITGDEFRNKYRQSSDREEDNLEKEAFDKFDSVMSRVYGLLRSSNKNYIQIKMPMFFTRSSKGRNSYLIKMVINELKNLGFEAKATYDGRYGDKNDYLTISVDNSKPDDGGYFFPNWKGDKKIQNTDNKRLK